MQYFLLPIDFNFFQTFYPILQVYNSPYDFREIFVRNVLNVIKE